MSKSGLIKVVLSNLTSNASVVLDSEFVEFFVGDRIEVRTEGQEAWRPCVITEESDVFEYEDNRYDSLVVHGQAVALLRKDGAKDGTPVEADLFEYNIGTGISSGNELIKFVDDDFDFNGVTYSFLALYPEGETTIN